MKTKFLAVGVSVAMAVAGGILPAYADAVSLSPSTVAVSVGGSNTVTISGGADFYVSSNSHVGLSTTTLVGNLLTVFGVADGTAVLSICSLSGSCADLTVNVGTGSGTGNSSSNSSGTNTTTVALSTASQTLAVGQSVNITISGSTSYFISNNSNSVSLQASISGNVLAVTGLTAGSGTLTVCGTSGGCATFTGTVTGTGTITPVTPAPVVVPVVTGGNSNPAALLATIQTMQSQLTQLLQAIQAMQAQLNQITTALGSVSANSVTVTGGPVYFSSLLSLNSTGSEVTALQQKLTKDGFYSGPITGKFGPLTEAALKAYQTSHGIDPVGYTGPATRAALNN